MKKKILIIGNFNVIHVGHLRLFSYAKKIADHLIVGVISDKNSNSDLLINENKRLEGLKSNKFINESFIIKTDLKDFIKRHKPHFYLKGKEFENQDNTEKKILNKIKFEEEIYIKFGSHSVKIDNNNCIDLIKNEKVEEKFKYIIFELDSRLLKWLLNGPKYAHWNNAEIGSHIKYYRKPNAYSRNLHASICYLHC